MIEDSYEEKVSYLNQYVGLDGTTIAGEDLLTLISLVNLVVMSNRKKAPDTTPLEVIKKIHNNEADLKNPGVIFIHERLSLMCEMFLIEGSKFRSFGLKNKDEIFAEINRIIDSWLPF